MPASNASDDAEMASNSSASLNTPAETQTLGTDPATPIRSHFPSEPTPPHTGPEPGPSLNANGKRALPGSNTDLAAQSMAIPGLQDALKGSFELDGAPPGSRWELGEDGIMVEADDEAGKESSEPGAKWKSRKGQEEMRKAMEQIVDREYMVKKKYGDVILDPRRQAQQTDSSPS